MKGTRESLQRLAQNVGHDRRLGVEIIEFLQRDEIRAQLIAAAEQGIPPASAISSSLLSHFGREALQPHTVHRFIGAAIRALLEEADFEPTSARVRLSRDPLFSTAATFKKRPAGLDPGTDDLLARFIDALTPVELERLQSYVDKKRNRPSRLLKKSSTAAL